LLGLADELDCAVIEDGAYQSLRYDGTPVPPVLALDCARSSGIENTRTLYCGSFSKTLSPGPAAWLGLCCKRCHLPSGAHEAGRRSALLKLSTRRPWRALPKPSLTRKSTRCALPTVSAGMPCWPQLKITCRQGPVGPGLRAACSSGSSCRKAADAAGLLKEAVETAKIAFVPGKAFFADGSGGNTLRLSFSATTPEKITEGISRLGTLIAKTVTPAL
jgi:DNA-binding transcriptional MocR family regulator